MRFFVTWSVHISPVWLSVGQRCPLKGPQKGLPRVPQRKAGVVRSVILTQKVHLYMSMCPILVVCVVSLGSEERCVWRSWANAAASWLLHTKLSAKKVVFEYLIEVGRTSGFSSFLAYSVGVMKLCTANPELTNFAAFFRWVTVDSSRSAKYTLRTSLEAFAALSSVDWLDQVQGMLLLHYPSSPWGGKVKRKWKSAEYVVCLMSEDTSSVICRLCQIDSFAIAPDCKGTASVCCRRHLWTLMARMQVKPQMS